MATTPQTFLERLDAELPPFCAYYHSRKYPRGPWAGPAVVAQRSGLSSRTVARLGSKVSWRGVDVHVMSAFLAGCGFEASKCSPFVMERLREYMRWCVTKALCPMNHLDGRAWARFNKLSQLHLNRQGLPTNNGNGEFIGFRARAARSTAGLKLLQRNAELTEENKQLRLRLKSLAPVKPARSGIQS